MLISVTFIQIIMLKKNDDIAEYILHNMITISTFVVDASLNYSRV